MDEWVGITLFPNIHHLTRLCLYNPFPFSCCSPTALFPAAMDPNASPFIDVSPRCGHGYRALSDLKFLQLHDQEFLHFDSTQNGYALQVGCPQAPKRNPPLTPWKGLVRLPSRRPDWRTFRSRPHPPHFQPLWIPRSIPRPSGTPRVPRDPPIPLPPVLPFQVTAD